MRNLELYQECFEDAFNLIRLVTHETEEEQQVNYKTNKEYVAVIQHLTDIYYTLKTNKYFNNYSKFEYELTKIKSNF